MTRIRVGALIMFNEWALEKVQGKLGLVIEGPLSTLAGDYKVLFEDKIYTVFVEEMDVLT